LGSDWKSEGADQMLVKPMNTNDLLRQIEALLIQQQDRNQERAAKKSASTAKRSETIAAAKH
jgi:DNA-binding response OmpR family regulator